MSDQQQSDYDAMVQAIVRKIYRRAAEYEARLPPLPPLPETIEARARTRVAELRALAIRTVWGLRPSPT
jgi:hypothetical protein